jgi:hypothetical protein
MVKESGEPADSKKTDDAESGKSELEEKSE